MASDQRPPTVVEFFKIMCEWNLRDEKIRLPNKFTRKCGGGLPNPVLLKLPDGTEWKVNWNKLDGVIWFEKGWKEFVKHYSLAHGHLLMFKYEVSSHFEVKIFDMSTLQIDYPHHVSNDEKAPNLEKLHVDVKAEDDPDEGAKFENKTNADPPRQQVQENKGKRTLQRERIPRAKNPTFKLYIKPSYVTGRCIPVPVAFAKNYLKEGPVCLKVGWRTWPVKFRTWKGNNMLKHKLQKGWTNFRRDNHLNVGDVCVFKLTKSTKVTTFTVLISRVGDKPSCSHSTV